MKIRHRSIKAGYAVDDILWVLDGDDNTWKTWGSAGPKKKSISKEELIDALNAEGNNYIDVLITKNGENPDDYGYTETIKDKFVKSGCTKKSVKASAGNSVELTFICPNLETGRSVVDKAREIGGFGSTWNETKWVYIDVPSTQSVDNVDDLIDYAQSAGVYLNRPSAKLLDAWADSKAQTVLRGCTEKPVKASAVMGAMDIENLTIYVPSYCYVDVMVDSYEQGGGEQVNSWTFQVADGFRTAQELIDDIAESSGIFSNDINDYVVLDSSLQTDATVNAENEIPTEEELEAWKRGELELYVAHLWVRLQVGSATHDITDEEAEAFGLSVY